MTFEKRGVWRKDLEVLGLAALLYQTAHRWRPDKNDRHGRRAELRTIGRPALEPSAGYPKSKFALDDAR